MTLLVCAAAQAATLNVSVSVNATLTPTASGGYTASGTTTLTGGISDNGTFAATITLGTTITGPYTMTLSKGTLTGTVSLPLTVLTGTGSGTLSVTGGTGSYSGDTGSFNISGSGQIGTSITAAFTGSGTINTTGGGGTGPTGPSITAIQDAGSYTNNVAQGGIFVVKGSGMSASGYNVQSLPYPTAAGTTSITFTPTAGGSGTQALMIYTYNQGGVNQLAALVPSTLATGNYNVTVTYNGQTSAGFATQVVAAKPELLTQDSTGSGLALAQNFIPPGTYDINRLTTGNVGGNSTSPAKPGQVLVIWGTGLGAVPFPDNTPPATGYSYPNVKVIVGGVSITPAYAGVSGYPGLDQINFTLPANIPTGCTVSVQVSVGNVTSAAASLAIAPNSSATSCVYPGLTQQQLQSLDQGGTYTVGGFSILQLTTSVPGLGSATTASIGGAFTQVTAFQLAGLPPSTVSTTNTTGSCTVVQVTVTGTGQVTAGGAARQLDAGKITLNGPAGSNISNVTVTETNNTYSQLLGGIAGLPGVPNGSIVAGTYSLSAAGGQDIGSFQTSITAGAPLSITGGLPASVTESAGLPLSWTGGNASDLVQIIGYSGSTTGTGANAVTAATEFICTSTAGTGGFTVPASVLTQLPKISSSAITAGTGSGFLEVVSGPTPVSFNAPLTAGGNVPSNFLVLTGTGGLVSYQ